MSQIKADLICEIIRVSQTNLLGKIIGGCPGEDDDQRAVEWIQKNAASYRQFFMSRLESLSLSELGGILKELKESRHDLREMLDGVPVPQFAEKKKRSI